MSTFSKKKKCKIPYFCTLFPKFGQKLVLLFFNIYKPLPPCKKLEKNKEPTLGKTSLIDKQTKTGEIVGLIQ